MNIVTKSIFLITLFFMSLTSCETRSVKYSAANDLVVGVQQVVLYENGEFSLELGLGGTEGTYTILNDTISLNYLKKPENWPDQILISDRFLETISTAEHRKPIRIKRK